MRSTFKGNENITCRIAHRVTMEIDYVFYVYSLIVVHTSYYNQIMSTSTSFQSYRCFCNKLYLQFKEFSFLNSIFCLFCTDDFHCKQIIPSVVQSREPHSHQATKIPLEPQEIHRAFLVERPTPETTAAPGIEVTAC